ncbi:DUF4430 domain-containing protein [Patescibacteria group bacterium]|nr:DUF4430 domain-containing protein [Patescibacteria group bacterium]
MSNLIIISAGQKFFMFKKLLILFLLAFALTGVGCAKAPEATQQSIAPAQSVTSTLTLQVNDKSYSIPFRDHLTVYDLMLGIQNKEDFTFDGKDYGPDMGFFVQKINEKTNDVDNNLYWVFYLNDQKASTGISATYLNPNDTITWKYEPLQF